MAFKFLLILFCLTIFSEGQPLDMPEPLKLCIEKEKEELCQQMAQDVPNTWVCVTATDKLDCAKKLENGEVDLVNMDPRAFYTSGKYHLGQAIAMEVVNNEPYIYQGVALVRKESNITKVEQLRGLRSCHTGFGKTTGWYMPLAFLRDNLLNAENTNALDCGEWDNIRIAKTIFSGGSCAPGNWSDDPIVDAELKARHPELCSRCADPSACSANDRYAGYEGAIRCLLEGSGDVAFTKAATYRELLAKDPSVADTIDLLCFDKDYPGYNTQQDPCTWGFRPTNAYVTTNHGFAHFGERLTTAINNTQSRYMPPDLVPEWYHKVFLSSPKSNGIERTNEDRTFYENYLGSFFLRSMEKPDCFNHDRWNVSLCVTSEDEREKCEDFAKAATSRNMLPVHCVTAVSKAACMEVIKQGYADVVTLDGGDVYKAGRYHGMQPISAEIYGNSDATYYAVAVIRSASDVTKLSELKGLRSCHTGMGRTAGYVVPVGALLRDGDMDVTECNRAAALAGFFTEGSCLPGANDTKYNPGRVGAEELCRYCIGDEEGKHKCSRDSKERYSGYAGAFRCLAEGRGDVAFVKHTTVPQYTDGNSPKELWSRDLLSSDFQLLCGEGGTAPVEQYEQCNLAKVPSHYVMTNGNANASTRLRLAQFLADSSNYFSDQSEVFRLFEKYKDTKADLLFKDSTTALKAAPLSAAYTQVLGEAFLKASEAVDPALCTTQK